MILSGGELSGCTSVFAIKDNDFYFIHAGKGDSDKSTWTTSQNGADTILKVSDMLLEKDTVAEPSTASLLNNTDLSRMLDSQYDQAVITFMGKGPSSRIDSPPSSKVTTFDYNKAVSRAIRVGLSFALISKQPNGSIVVKTLSEDNALSFPSLKIKTLNSVKVTLRSS